MMKVNQTLCEGWIFYAGLWPYICIKEHNLFGQNNWFIGQQLKNIEDIDQQHHGYVTSKSHEEKSLREMYIKFLITSREQTTWVI